MKHIYTEKEENLISNYDSTIVRFSDLFEDVSSSPIEQQQRVVKELVDFAIEQSNKAGNYILPENFGDILLGLSKSTSIDVEKKAKEIGTTIKILKETEYVTDQDIKSWWNKTDIERVLKIADANARFNKSYKEYYVCQDDGLEEEKKQLLAYGCVSITLPIYGTVFMPLLEVFSMNYPILKGENRHLSYELKERIEDKFVGGGNYSKTVNMFLSEESNEINSIFSSLNAYIRDQIKKGII